MTEGKRKRGRPKKVNLELPDGVTLLDGSETRPPGYAIDFDKCPQGVDKMLEQLPKLPKKPVSYPSNWNELGKVAKLQWLTEHRK